MGNENLGKALALSQLGLQVFPVRLGKDNTKTPLTSHGHIDASDDETQIRAWWVESPNALVGVNAGGSGLIVLDVDVKNGKDGWSSLEEAWLEVPETFGYDTGTGGRHLVYAAPDDIKLSPSSNFMGLTGVDVRAGSSWVLWVGPVPSSRSEFTPAPEWLCVEQTVRSVEAFEGDLKAWFESLVPGEPNLLVRRAIERIHDDMSHSEMVERQFEAIRLGAEGNTGVPQLLSRLESAWLARPVENHTTPEDKWEYKFAEALSSGVAKYGDAIQLLKDLPKFSPELIPAGVPDTLVFGVAGSKTDFSALLSQLVSVTLDPLQITSILWSSPVTKDLAREWGLEFVYRRVTDALNDRNPETPVPALSGEAPAPRSALGLKLLSEDEEAQARAVWTFIDSYMEASNTKGFVNPTYSIPLAWTCLSMAVGYRAFLPVNGSLGLNLWFNIFGYSGTGKTKEAEFAQSVLDIACGGQDTYWNLGASSSPEGLHEQLLVRDKLASCILEDEASTFFGNLRTKDWMSTITHFFSDWYTGSVRPSNKVRLKELKGVSANTSFCMALISTPDKALRLLDTEMFETGFLARSNWSLGEPPGEKESSRFVTTETDTDTEGTLPAAREVALDLIDLYSRFGKDRVKVRAVPEARKRLDEAHERMDRVASSRDLYNLTEPSVTRLSETAWKCAALLALWRGTTVISLQDVLVSLRYVQDWFATLFEVVQQIAQSDFQRDCMEIVDFLESRSEPTPRTTVLKAFGSLIRRSRSELYDRIDFLLESGVIKAVQLGKVVAYEPTVRKG